MSFFKTQALSVVTSASSAYSGSTPEVNGRLMEVRFDSTALNSTGVLTVSCTATGETFLTCTISTANTWVKRPRLGTVTSTGGSIVYSTGGMLHAVSEPPILVDQKIKLAIADGGASKTGTVTFVIG